VNISRNQDLSLELKNYQSFVGKRELLETIQNRSRSTVDGATNRFSHRVPGSNRCDLFCFPHAGGNAVAYREWSELVPKGIGVSGVNPPRTASEPTRLHRELEGWAGKIAAEISDTVTESFALFGHSMGAIVAFETARKLTCLGRPPTILYVAGAPPPHLPRKERMAELVDADLLVKLRAFKGMPLYLFEDAATMALILPLIRADLRAYEAFEFVRGEPLSCPILAMGGLEDREVSPEELQEWEQHTTNGFSLSMIKGGHFFPQTARLETIERVAISLQLRLADRG
jgi:surfactin synthase thioesterase subunit